MKKCPKCNRAYDDLQAFCLDDGAPLLSDSGVSSQETIVLPRQKNKLPVIFGSALMLVATLLGGWFLLGSKASDTNRNNRQPTTNIQKPVATATPVPVVETPTPVPSVSPTPTVTPEVNASVSTNFDAKPDNAVNSKSADEVNAAKTLPSIMKAEDHSVLFALQECRKSGSSITCQLSITNKGQDRQFRLKGYDSRLFDELGNGYKGSETQIANQTGNSPEIGFINNVTTRAQMTFEKVELNAAKITLLNIAFQVGDDYNLSVKFRNVPLIVSK